MGSGIAEVGAGVSMGRQRLQALGTVAITRAIWQQQPPRRFWLYTGNEAVVARRWATRWTGGCHGPESGRLQNRRHCGRSVPWPDRLWRRGGRATGIDTLAVEGNQQNRPESRLGCLRGQQR